MVFKSKVKEELFQELKQFIFWYYSRIASYSVDFKDHISILTHKLIVRCTRTKNQAVLVSLMDKHGNTLFKLEFYFISVDGVDYVIINYSEVDGLGSLKTFALTDITGIDDFLVQLIKFIPSESYLKHYLNVFKNGIRSWLT